jgi:hypothetical protein
MVSTSNLLLLSARQITSIRAALSLSAKTEVVSAKTQSRQKIYVQDYQQASKSLIQQGVKLEFMFKIARSSVVCVNNFTKLALETSADKKNRSK